MSKYVEKILFVTESKYCRGLPHSDQDKMPQLFVSGFFFLGGGAKNLTFIPLQVPKERYIKNTL